MQFTHLYLIATAFGNNYVTHRIKMLWLWLLPEPDDFAVIRHSGADL